MRVKSSRELQLSRVVRETYSGFPAASSETIPWLSLTFLCSFSLTLWYIFDFKCRVQLGEKILENIWFEEKVHLNHSWNLVHLSQTKIPWLSPTLNKFPWLSRRNFFPWFSLIFPDVGNAAYCHVPGRWGLQQKTPWQTHEQRWPLL